MGSAGRSAAVQIVLVAAGFAFLLAAAIAGGFESGLADALAAAAPWLAATGVAWTAAAWLELGARERPPATPGRAALLAAVWLAAVVLAAGLAGLIGHGGVAFAVWLVTTVAVAAAPTRALLRERDRPPPT
jgi:hypothetical protein